MTEQHPLLAILLDAANGAFPPADGRVTYLPPIAEGYDVSIGFTGHAVLCTAHSADDIRRLDLDGYGRALDPVVLAQLGGPGATYGSLDVMLVACGIGGGALSERFDLNNHPRVTVTALRIKARQNSFIQLLPPSASALSLHCNASIRLKERNCFLSAALRLRVRTVS